MAPRVRCIAFEQILGPDRDRYLFALIDFDDDDGAPLALFHHSNTLVLGDALQLAYIGKKKRRRHPEATIGQFVSPLAWPCLTQGFSRQHSEIFVQPSRLTVDVLDNNAYCLTFFHATWKTNIGSVINEALDYARAETLYERIRGCHRIR